MRMDEGKVSVGQNWNGKREGGKYVEKKNVTICGTDKQVKIEPPS